jgi:hypothetical protein
MMRCVPERRQNRTPALILCSMCWTRAQHTTNILGLHTDIVDHKALSLAIPSHFQNFKVSGQVQEKHSKPTPSPQNTSST